jgi:pyruvate-formate lyase-activating enzyme
MNYSGIINCSIVDGLDFRTTLFISGCKHCCEGCHNPHTWDFNAGRPYTKEVEDILFDRISEDYIKGLTLSVKDTIISFEGRLKGYSFKSTMRIPLCATPCACVSQ